MEQGGEILAALPPMLFQVRLGAKLGNEAEAEVRDDGVAGGNAQQGFQGFEIENADPAYANRFGARRQPQVLDRAGGRVENRGRIGLAAEPMAEAALGVAGDAEVDRRVQYALQFQTVVDFALRAAVNGGGAAVGGGEIGVHRAAQGGVFNQNKIPRLHEAYRWRMMGSVENAAQNRRRQWPAEELAAHVAAFVDGAVDAAFFVNREGVAGVRHGSLVFTFAVSVEYQQPLPHGRGSVTRVSEPRP